MYPGAHNYDKRDQGFCLGIVELSDSR